MLTAIIGAIIAGVVLFLLWFAYQFFASTTQLVPTQGEIQAWK